MGPPSRSPATRWRCAWRLRSSTGPRPRPPGPPSAGRPSGRASGTAATPSSSTSPTSAWLPPACPSAPERMAAAHVCACVVEHSWHVLLASSKSRHFLMSLAPQWALRVESRYKFLSLSSACTGQVQTELQPVGGMHGIVFCSAV